MTSGGSSTGHAANGSVDMSHLSTIIFDLDSALHQLDIDWHEVRRQLGIADSDEETDAAIQRLRLSHDPQLEIVTQAELAAVGERTLARDIVGTLQALHHAGRHVAVLTRNSRRAVTTLLENTDGHDLPTSIFIVGREDVERPQPDSSGVQFILDHFGVEAGKAALVGGTSHDIEAAHKARLLSIVVKKPALGRAPQGADAYVEAIPDILALLDVAHDKSLLWP